MLLILSMCYKAAAPLPPHPHLLMELYTVNDGRRQQCGWLLISLSMYIHTYNTHTFLLLGGRVVCVFMCVGGGGGKAYV